jgi:hypothetical protein
VVAPAKLTVVVAAAPAGVTVGGLKEQVIPDGSPEQAKLTAELKPFVGVTETVAVAGELVVPVPLLGLIVSAKSGTGTVIETLTAFDAEAENPAAPA